MRQFGYDKHVYYGRFSRYTQKQTKSLINQVVAAGYLKTVGGDYPILKLTPKGETMLANRVPIPLKLPHAYNQSLSSTATSPKTKKLTPKAGVPESLDWQDSKNLISQIVALGESGDQTAVPDLIAALAHENGNARRLAASALGKLKAPEAVQPLLQLLAHEEKPQVRQYAVKALGKIGDPAAHAALTQIAADETEKYYTRDSAEAALKKLGKSSKKRLTSSSTQSTYNQVDDRITAFLTSAHTQTLTK